MHITTPHSLLVQGWTGINHSYAMVNQYQLLELMSNPVLNLYCQQMPWFDDRWSKERIGSGFTAQEQAKIEALPAYAGQKLSATYRIHSPNTLSASDSKVITFLVTELGLDERSFAAGADVGAYLKSGNLIVTPSNWSRERLVDFGFTPESVFVVPHGVDSSKFSPYSEHERAVARSALGYTDDDVVFLNVGAPIWNKGLDLVIQAYFATRQTCKNARLLIKDQQALYGLTAVGMIQNLTANGTIQIDNDSVESIRILPQTLTIEQLRGLYNVADFYLSPYRAEGFNLPVIEAVACGVKVIVTEGGATDDFCDDQVAYKIPSAKHVNAKIGTTRVGAYLQPDVDALIQIMRSCCTEHRVTNSTFASARSNMIAQFSWQRAATLITSLI